MSQITREIVQLSRLVRRIRTKDAGWLEWLHPRNSKGEFATSSTFRPACLRNVSGTHVSPFPILNLSETKTAQFSEEAFRRAVSGIGPRPVEKTIPVSALASLQDIVETRKVKAIAKKYRSETELAAIPDKPRVFKYGEKYVIVNGNHRAAAALRNGHASLKVSYLGDFSNL